MTVFRHLFASMLLGFDLPLWEMVIKSTLAIALTALVCQLLRGHSAALRHRVWVIGLAATLLLPLASFLLPQFLVRVLPPIAPPSVAMPAPQPINPSHDLSTSNTPRAFSENSDAPQSRAAQDLTAIVTNSDAADPITQGQPVDVVARPRFEQLLILTWLVVSALSAALFVMVLIVQRLRLGRLKKIEDADWIAAVTAAAKALGLQRRVMTLQSDAACVPAVVGVFTPRLVIPADWRRWSPSQRHCVLLHELAHIQRRDVAAQLLGQLALLAYWFNPLVWYAVRQLRAERELASDDCVLQAGQAASDYAQQLLRMLRSYRPARLGLGVAMAHSARLDQRVLAILDPQRPRATAGLGLTYLMSFTAATFVCTCGSLTLTSQAADAAAPGASAQKPGPVWQENYAVEFPGALPVSVAFSSDGKFLLTGDTSGEIMPLILAHEHPTYQWKTKVGGSHAAVAYSADQKHVYATTKDGICILDATTGKEQERIEVADSSPIALGVFPDKQIVEGVIRHQIAFGNPRGYFVESWVDGKLADTRGTIETSTVAKDAKPTDEAAVPLAIDPEGRSAIMTGPIDATGQSGGVKGKNVLWAYVCGDYADGSPGNRVLVGHRATVVSAAWSKEGSTAVTGDAEGRVIIWDAKTMKEAHRLELGGRVAALAISDDGARTAAYVLGKQGEVYVWDASKPVERMKSIHTELSDFAGPDAFASLAFSSDGKRLAGCAMHKKWLTRLGDLIGKVRVWELSAAPKAQVAPKRSYVQEVPGERSTNFVMLNNESLLMPASKEGAVDLRRIRDGQIQARIVLGRFTIGGVRISSDYKWVAIEHRSIAGEAAAFDIGIYSAPILYKSTVPGCNQLLDISSGGKVGVVRGKQIELWDIATVKKAKAAPPHLLDLPEDVAVAKKLKVAPFKHTEINTAAFSPDGQLLAITEGKELILWRWEEDKHERIDLGRPVGALAFSPNGKLLAEGPSSGKEIQIRDLESKKVVQTLTLDTARTMDIARIVFAQGGRVLVACDDIVLAKKLRCPTAFTSGIPSTVRWLTGLWSRPACPKTVTSLPTGDTSLWPSKTRPASSSAVGVLMAGSR